MKKGEKIFSYVLLALSAVCIIGAFFIVPISELTVSSPGGYPVFVACLCFVLAAITAFRKPEEVDSEGKEEKLFDRTILIFIAMLVMYALAIIYLHYTVATLLFLFVSIFYLRKKDWRMAILVSYICTFLILLVFKYAFSVILP